MLMVVRAFVANVARGSSTNTTSILFLQSRYRIVLREMRLASHHSSNTDITVATVVMTMVVVTVVVTAVVVTAVVVTAVEVMAMGVG